MAEVDGYGVCPGEGLLVADGVTGRTVEALGGGSQLLANAGQILVDASPLEFAGREAVLLGQTLCDPLGIGGEGRGRSGSALKNLNS